MTTGDIISDDLPTPRNVHIWRELRSDGNSGVVIEVTTLAPNGTYTNPVKISCDYGAVPHLAGALQIAGQIVLDHLPLHGGE